MILNFKSFLVMLSCIIIEGMLVVSKRIQDALVIAFIVIIIQQYGINKLQNSYVKYKGLFKAYKEMYSNRANKKVIEGVE